MSDVRAKSASKDVVCLAIADLHLWPTPPIARSAEPDWKKTLKGYLDQVSALQQTHDCPILIAGDFFDKWNAPAELINFCIRYLPAQIYGIPGQHDLENHVLEHINRTAYWTLASSGVVRHLYPKRPVEINVKGHPIRLHGFPWSVPIQPLQTPHDLIMEIAVVHDYIWTRDTGYKDAPTEKRLANRSDHFGGYDVVVAGDNHIPFTKNVVFSDLVVHNCGSFIRRKRDEVDHKPSVGLIYADNTVTCHYLDVSQDKWSDVEEVAEAVTDINTSEFMEDLAKLQDVSINFQAALKRFWVKYGTDPDVQEAVTKAMERKRK